jgi:uncharacterized protein YqhQ
LKKDNNAQTCATKRTSIGGQALIEGIMMRGPKISAMAVRTPEGEIVLEKWENESAKRPPICKWPFVRGIFNFIDSMRAGYKALMRSAEIAGLEEVETESAPAAEQPEDTAEVSTNAVESKKATKKDEAKTPWYFNVLMVLSALLGVAIAIMLFMYLPSQLYSWLTLALPALEGKYLVRAIFEGVLRILIFVGYMAAVAMMKDIKRTFMYHGAEHKTIFCYEKGLPLTVENVKKQQRFHPRCGTSFLILMLLVSIVISMFIRIDNAFLRTGIKLLLIPVIVGIGYEMIRLAGRKDNIFTRIMSAPGMWLQRISTVEPTEDEMIECAILAFMEVLPEEELEAERAKLAQDGE